MNNYLSAALDIINLTNNILHLINAGASEDIVRVHFNSIGRIAAQQAAKTEIHGYSEHE